MTEDHFHYPLEQRDHADRRAIAAVTAEVLKRVPRGLSPEEYFGDIVRQAIDEVVTLGVKRYSINDLEAPEKTYIGTRVEVLVRDSLDFAAGARADARIAGYEVDLKWSKTKDWMIGPENLDTVCLGIGLNPKGDKVSVGLFVPHVDQLGGTNRDAKYTAGAGYRRKHVVWLVEDADLPPNFIESLQPTIRDYIMSGTSAQERIRRLAESVPGVPVPRSAIRLVSFNKDDFMRRTRQDATRRTPPLGDMVCLSWNQQKYYLEQLGITLKPRHFVFVHNTKLRSIPRPERALRGVR